MILLRPQASPVHGAGHAMRCLSVAEALADQGVEVALALDDISRASAPRLERAGIALVGPDPRPCAAVLLDGYGFTDADEAAWRAAGAKVAAFEDVPGRTHACELLIDTAPGRRPEAYAACAPGAKLLLGTDYAPVGRAFREGREAALERHREPGPLRRILVSTGMMDVGGLAGLALAALNFFPEVEIVDVAVGAAAVSLPKLKAAAEADLRVRLHLDTAEMAMLTASADLAIGAAGVSTWERCALGLPSLTALTADNQADNAAALTGSGAALGLGKVDALHVRDLIAAIRTLEPPEPRAAMAEQAAAMVDGRGAERIAEALRALT